MAETLPELPQPRRSDGTFVEIYPWDDWLDGRIWRVKQGVDFQVSPRSFATMVRVTAWRRGLRARTRIDLDGEHVSFQVTPGPHEPRVAKTQRRDGPPYNRAPH